MLQYRLYNGGHLPANKKGFVKAGANIESGNLASVRYTSHENEQMSDHYLNPGTLLTPYARLSVSHPDTDLHHC